LGHWGEARRKIKPLLKVKTGTISEVMAWEFLVILVILLVLPVKKNNKNPKLAY